MYLLYLLLLLLLAAVLNLSLLFLYIPWVFELFFFHPIKIKLLLTNCFVNPICLRALVRITKSKSLLKYDDQNVKTNKKKGFQRTLLIAVVYKAYLKKPFTMSWSNIGKTVQKCLKVTPLEMIGKYISLIYICKTIAMYSAFSNTRLELFLILKPLFRIE